MQTTNTHQSTYKIPHHFRFILILAASLLYGGAAVAQTLTMQNGETLYSNLCASGAYIYDNGGPDGNYTNSFQGWVVLTTNVGATITLTGTYNIENNYDFLTIYDNETQIFRQSGSGTINVVATSGTMKIQFTTDGSVNRTGFALHAATSAPPTECNSTAHNLAVSNLNATSCTLTWEGSGENLMLDYGAGAIAVSGNSYDITGLTGSTNYDINLY